MKFSIDAEIYFLLNDTKPQEIDWYLNKIDWFMLKSAYTTDFKE